jgi:SAM-dependent methyltransferase
MSARRTEAFSVHTPGSRGETRDIGQLREHYEVEKELADRLRHASRDERLTLYGDVYDELFKRVPNHPQRTRQADPAATAGAVAGQIEMLEPFLEPEATFLEVGAGDCALSAAVAQRVKKVYAIDVSEEITRGLTLPDNVELRLSDGTSIPVPPGSVDISYSNQLMEHLHPDDAFEQLRNLYDCLKPGGVYLCVTPNRVTGPHDISMFFDTEATGFHLKEYTIGELHRLFTNVGFSAVTVLVGGRGRYRRIPPLPAEIVERLVGILPTRAKAALVHRWHANFVLGIRVIAAK